MAFDVAGLRLAYRSLRATPLVSALAVLSLALGIGANTALFSIFNSLLLRTLPVRDPAALAVLQNGSWTHPIWTEVERRSRDLFDGAFAWSTDRFDLSQGGESEFVDGAYASARIFDVLGVSAIRGRTFTEADNARGGGPDGPVAVISHRFWQQHFAGSPDAIGRKLVLARVPFAVVGVLPAGFTGPDVGRATDVFITFGAEPLIRRGESFLDARSTWWLDIMARVKPGQSVDQANAALRGVQSQIRAATIPDKWSAEMLAGYLRDPFTLAPAGTGNSPMRSKYEAPLVAMIGAVSLVLLIACANIANLLLARAITRRRELSVRLALGASRWQLARLLLAESLTIATLGAALGLLFAEWSGALLVRQFSTWRETIFLDLALDWRVLGFTAALTIITALVAGVGPALGVTAVAPQEALRESGRGIAGDRRLGLRNVLVVAQIALSLVLVVAAGLFLRTFVSLSRVPLGFTPEPLLIAELDMQQSRFGQPERPALLERIHDAVAASPGINAVGLSRVTPVSGRGWNTIVGEAPGFDRSRMSWLNAVTPGWFEAYGMNVVAGRDFDTTDRQGGEVVAIVNETFARKFLGGQPVGQMAVTGGPGGNVQRRRVVGVVSDAVYRSPREGMMPTMYVPFAQLDRVDPSVTMTVAIAPGQRAAAMRAVTAAAKQVDPDTAFTFRTFDDLVGATVIRERLVALLSAFFGGLALLLAGIGLYGVMSHAVNRRRTEIGVRMALGADPAVIARLVLQRVAIMIAVGVVAGAALALWASRFVQTLLFQLDARDPSTFAAAAIVLIAVGIVAAWLPARRAARLDPASVLREG